MIQSSSETGQIGNYGSYEYINYQQMLEHILPLKRENLANAQFLALVSAIFGEVPETMMQSLP